LREHFIGLRGDEGHVGSGNLHFRDLSNTHARDYDLLLLRQQGGSKKYDCDEESFDHRIRTPFAHRGAGFGMNA
jgi:hypothetical protein